jgi:hypothetical protein
MVLWINEHHESAADYMLIICRSHLSYFESTLMMVLWINGFDARIMSQLRSPLNYVPLLRSESWSGCMQPFLPLTAQLFAQFGRIQVFVFQNLVKRTQNVGEGGLCGR